MQVGNASPREDYFQLTNKLVLKHINILYGRVPFSLSAAMSWNNHWLCFLQLSKTFHSWNKRGTKYHESKRNIPYNESSEFVALSFREFTSSLNREIKEEFIVNAHAKYCNDLYEFRAYLSLNVDALLLPFYVGRVKSQKVSGPGILDRRKNRLAKN